MRQVIFLIAAIFSANIYAETPWEKYLQTLSPKQAAQVSAIEYSSKLKPEAEGPRLTSDLALLSTQVLAGDQQAFLLAVRLEASTAPGANLEDLVVMVGRYARLNPRAFLQAKSANSQCLGIASPGLEFVDRTQARMHELAERRTALLTVQAKALKAVRARCLSELDTANNSLKSDTVSGL